VLSYTALSPVLRFIGQRRREEGPGEKDGEGKKGRRKQTRNEIVRKKKQKISRERKKLEREK
jgi:hypothetical protein